MTRYRTIVAAAPWPIGDFPAWFDEDRRSARENAIGINPTPYDTMTLSEIKALPVGDLSDDSGDAHLYLWTIDSLLEESFEVVRAWGFQHVRTIVWCKASMGAGLGGRWPSNLEFVLFCRRLAYTRRPDAVEITKRLYELAQERGLSKRAVDEHMGTGYMAQTWWLSKNDKYSAIPSSEHWPRLRDLLGAHELDNRVNELNAKKGTGELTRAPSSWFDWPRGPHSAKPEAFLDLVEQVSPGPYLELFARRQRLGWDTWGNEALNHVEMDAS